MKLTIIILLLLTILGCSPQSQTSHIKEFTNSLKINYENISNDSLLLLFKKEVNLIDPYYSTSSYSITKMMKDTLCEVITEMDRRKIIGKLPIIDDYIYIILLKGYIHQRYCCGQGYTMYTVPGTTSDGFATDIITNRFFDIFSIDKQHQEMETTGSVADYLKKQHLVIKQKPYFLLIHTIDSIHHSKGFGYSVEN